VASSVESAESLNKAGDRATNFCVGLRDNLGGLPASPVTVISASVVSSSSSRSNFGSWLLLCDLYAIDFDADLEDADGLGEAGSRACACMSLLSAISTDDATSSIFISSRAWPTPSGRISRVSSAIVFAGRASVCGGCGGDNLGRCAEARIVEIRNV